MSVAGGSGAKAAMADVRTSRRARRGAERHRSQTAALSREGIAMPAGRQPVRAGAMIGVAVTRRRRRVTLQLLDHGEVGAGALGQGRARRCSLRAPLEVSERGDGEAR